MKIVHVFPCASTQRFRRLHTCASLLQMPPNKSPDGSTVSLLHTVPIYVTLDPLPPCILFRVDGQCAGSGADPGLQAAAGNKNRLPAQAALTHDTM